MVWKMTIRRRTVIAAIGGFVVAHPVQVLSQHQRTPKVGVLVLQDSDGEALSTELREGLRELHYKPGENIRLEFRSAGGQSGRLEGLAVDLVRLNVDVIVALYTPCALAAKQATSAVPIVAAAAGDPV